MNKQIGRLLLFAMMLLASCTCTYAASGVSHSVEFKVHVQTGYEGNEKDRDPETLRKPMAPLVGTIDSENGIQIPGLDKSLVLSYELYSEEACLGSWCDEADLIMQLSEQYGFVEIRINMPEYYFSGYANLRL